MPLTDAQRARVVAAAKSAGIDPDELLAEAEKMAAEDAPMPAATSGVAPAKETPAVAVAPDAQEPAKLFEYHLPFVTVNEVRTVWLGLDEWTADQGGDENAAAFAAKVKGATPTAQPRPVPTAIPSGGRTLNG